jgi:hypothetical protein
VLARGNTLNAGTVFCALPILAYRKPNEDGKHDSLCLRCFWTAAIGLSEARLAEAEIKHVCGRVPALIGLRQFLPMLH